MQFQDVAILCVPGRMIDVIPRSKFSSGFYSAVCAFGVFWRPDVSIRASVRTLDEGREIVRKRLRQPLLSFAVSAYSNRAERI